MQGRGKETSQQIFYEIFQALQEEIILNKIGKFIPYIFMEWGQLPKSKNCKNFTQWVEHFYAGDYVPLDSGKPPVYKYFSDDFPCSQHVESEQDGERQTLGHCLGSELCPMICKTTTVIINNISPQNKNN